ncbi:flagellar motor switch phosphatase FliY [Effusibacillus lacus]|uniref:Flagellar motor switch phosphatase FliY n=1 Tax=Effusibacillus lacus TaxID=1348429 RepID=A0A292YQ52_9BACL|nr:flagellar motor switch phosphatase FliY [Effusibacillus lacus]TCS73129.1 flagellar motor switch protein FliN/FliY [Effusibacillus lacus]GAX90534.1 flagellar motor switch phosphatase FliY [Effusibacillus lacus]
MTGNDFLSQEEIDALLRQGGVSKEEEPAAEELLTEFDKDALGEIGNISFGTAATALSTLLRHKVEITTPAVTVIRREELVNDLPIPHAVIKVDYTDGFVGSNVLAIKIADAQVIADLMLGGDGKVEIGELNELHMSAVAEAMNQMMGSAATSMSTIFNMMVNITPPKVEVLSMDQQQASQLFPADEIVVKISFRLIVGDLIDSQIMQLVPITFARTMLDKLTGQTQSAEPAPAQPSQPAATHQAEQHQPVGQPAMYQPVMEQPAMQQPAMQQPMAAQGHYMPPSQQAMGYPYPPAPGYGMSAGGYTMPQGGHFVPPTVNVQPAQFATFEAVDPAVLSSGNLNLLLDVPLQVTVELGRTRKQIREILELGTGSILELDKLAGEPVDILVNSKLIAKGEVVVIDENFGVRVTDILTPAERISKLQ